ncbi:uncharacterized protein LOC135091581 [Scylla paramamosain]|uniref:uncharacterized protein LOC135091581 n=1 Tax=Scylla paramamosain TaxID=85552 RepID=UPI003082EB33
MLQDTRDKIAFFCSSPSGQKLHDIGTTHANTRLPGRSERIKTPAALTHPHTCHSCPTTATMKVQVCTALVVVLAAAMVVEAGPRHRSGFWFGFIRQVTSEVCGDDKCFPEGRECFKQMRPQNYTEDMLEEVKTNLTECAGDVDFSALQLEDIIPNKEGHHAFHLFMSKFNVGDTDKQYALLQCFLERNGQLPALLSCLREIQTDAATGTS